MNIQDVLRHDPEPCPPWLMAVTPGVPPRMREFLDSRTVFYPGSGVDGHAIKVFAGARAAHCFVYADYWVTRDSVIAAIESNAGGYEGGLRGYRPLARFDLSAADFPVTWGPHTSRFAPSIPPWSYKQAVAPYAFLQVFERLPDVDATWGAQRVALLMLGADAHATFEGLYCQPKGAQDLYAMLVQDHGFGGNYSPFGSGGLTEQMARHHGICPRWQLVGDASTRAWSGYEKVQGVEPSLGSGQQRFLYAHRSVMPGLRVG